MPELKDQPVHTGQVGPEGGGPALELRLLSGSQIFRNFAEVQRAMRHRYVLANCAGLTVPAVFLLYALDSTTMPIDLQVPSVVIGLVTAQMLAILYLRLATRLARMKCPNQRFIRIWITPGLMLGAAGMMAVAHFVHQVMGSQQDWTELRSHLVPFVCVLYLEIAAAFLFRGPIPRALAQLRVGQEPMPDFAAEVADAGDSMPVGAAERGGDDASGVLPQHLAVGMAAAEILRLEASGNYVTVVMRKGRHLVPGPFSAVLAQIPDGLGRQVQRSHWVALDAVEGMRRKGREIVLQTVCGALVPVSAAQRSEVQAWLEAQGKALPAIRAAGGQGGGGQVIPLPARQAIRAAERLQ